MSVDDIIRRLLSVLAMDLSYSLAPSELDLYSAELMPYGLPKLRLAITKLLAEPRPRGTYPSVSEFKRLLG